MENFSNYFKQQATTLINQAEKNKFYITCDFSQVTLPSYNDKIARENFLSEILNDYKRLPLTNRKIECLYYLVKGMTQKQIAAHLKLSPKTVVHAVEQLKQKMNCNSRYELIRKALTYQEIKDKLTTSS